MSEVLKCEGVTKMLPRFDALHAARGFGVASDRASSGSNPSYVPEGVVMFVMRACADTMGMRARSGIALKRDMFAESAKLTTGELRGMTKFKGLKV